MLCRKCREKLKDTPTAFDAFAFLQQRMQYCENKDCEEFGYVTMVGYPEKEEKDEMAGS